MAASLDPNLAIAHLNLGAAYAERGELDRAIAELEAAVRLEPESVEAHFNLGLVRAWQGETALARASFEQVIVLAPESKWAAQAQTQLKQLEP
jgi:tetratricopeptide (TPR) repeat protein